MQKSKYYRSLYFWGFLLLPLFYWPSAPVPFEVPKGVFLGVWVAFACLLTIWRVFSQEIRVAQSKLTVLGLAAIFGVISAVASVQGVDVDKSWWGNYYRVDGLVYSLILLVFALTVALNARHEREQIVAGIKWGSMLVSIWALAQWTLWGFSGHPAAGLGNTNFLAGYLAIALVFWLPDLVKSKLGTVGCITILFAIFTTGAVGGLLTAGLVLILWVVFDRKRLLSVFAALLFVVSVSAGALWYHNYQTRPLGAPVLAEGRERIFVKLGLAVLEKPWFGWGVANVDYAFEANFWPITFLNDVYVDKAHSHLLEVLVTTGIVGEMAYIALLAATGWTLVAKYRKATGGHKVWYKTLLIALTAYVFHTQTNVVSVAEDVMFWTVLGLA